LPVSADLEHRGEGERVGARELLGAALQRLAVNVGGALERGRGPAGAAQARGHVARGADGDVVGGAVQRGVRLQALLLGTRN